VKCRQAPVNAIDAKMFGQVIFQLIATLLPCVSLIPSVWPQWWPRSEYGALYRAFGCRPRACQ
jgi:hypothetical protein